MLKLGLYQHYKGYYYQVMGVARHEETHKALVIYQALYGDFALWARDIDIFKSSINFEGNEVPRFRFIKDNLATMPQLN